MNISQETLDLIFDVQEFTDEQLKNRTETGFILESTYMSGNRELFDAIIFKARYIQGLGAVLGKGTLEDERLQKPADEFKRHAEEFAAMLRNVSRNFPNSLRNEFDRKYLALTHDSFINLLTLVNDLALVKKYLTEKKYED